jgi:hypothetical protein
MVSTLLLKATLAHWGFSFNRRWDQQGVQLLEGSIITELLRKTHTRYLFLLVYDFRSFNKFGPWNESS